MGTKVMPQARLPTAPREMVRAGHVVRGSLEGLRVRSRSGLKEGMPPCRCRGDPAGDPTTGAPGGGGCAGNGAAAEAARRSIDGSCAAAVGLEVSCSSCACNRQPHGIKDQLAFASVAEGVTSQQNPRLFVYSAILSAVAAPAHNHRSGSGDHLAILRLTKVGPGSPAHRTSHALCDALRVVGA